LTKDNYIKCIKQAGFQDVKILNEHTYLAEDKTDGRKITSIIIGSITK
jgi:arsenite methyltransferase